MTARTTGIVFFCFFCALLCGGVPAAQPRAVVESEMQTLANQLTLCQLDTGFFVSLETLNDSGFSLADPSYDFINEHGGSYALRPSDGYFLANRVDLIDRFLDWQGPYVTYQQGRTQTAATPYDQGSPLDPWNNPYLFFSPLGLIRGDSGEITQEYYGDQFDTYMIVSLGPDGEKSADDVAWSLGVTVTDFVISGIGGPSVALTSGGRVFSIRSGTAITVRGYHLGSPQNDGTASFSAESGGGGATPRADTDLTGGITEWTDTAVTLTLPAGLIGAGRIALQRGGETSNPLAVSLFEPVNAAASWTLYR
jgi:hypothetical protein